MAFCNELIGLKHINIKKNLNNFDTGSMNTKVIKHKHLTFSQFLFP